ncbi:hypothetical protein AMAG_09255 [Allomyces macrogynus ATCC 38327]|uniref:MIF4G domain-containing protein n=1 Tax=Allomyces macrogynus (strain ATCC 38327) TaxID=578462 RepID=A0A0L0SNZ1_ALLM3|nr:hypothetical protein AMAG_09255 [Allomyces macrogynus ATCC 38327]|eukprot:KNE64212.1 hypothetical protein AMAG_09255 [Allomyces macrogynus ATCC 38327]
MTEPVPETKEVEETHDTNEEPVENEDEEPPTSGPSSEAAFPVPDDNDDEQESISDRGEGTLEPEPHRDDDGDDESELEEGEIRDDEPAVEEEEEPSDRAADGVFRYSVDRLRALNVPSITLPTTADMSPFAGYRARTHAPLPASAYVTGAATATRQGSGRGACDIMGGGDSQRDNGGRRERRDDRRGGGRDRDQQQQHGARNVALLPEDLKPLEHSEARWVPETLAKKLGAAATPEGESPEELYVKQIEKRTRGLLNRLTPENMEKLQGRFVEPLESMAALKSITALIVKKSFDEPKYASLYAQLTLYMCRFMVPFSTMDQSEEAFKMVRTATRKLVITACHDQFQHRPTWADKSTGKISEEEFEEVVKIKGKALGNMRGRRGHVSRWARWEAAVRHVHAHAAGFRCAARVDRRTQPRLVAPRRTARAGHRAPRAVGPRWIAWAVAMLRPAGGRARPNTFAALAALHAHDEPVSTDDEHDHRGPVSPPHAGRRGEPTAATASPAPARGSAVSPRQRATSPPAATAAAKGKSRGDGDEAKYPTTDAASARGEVLARTFLKNPEPAEVVDEWAKVPASQTRRWTAVDSTLCEVAMNGKLKHVAALAKALAMAVEEGVLAADEVVRGLGASLLVSEFADLKIDVPELGKMMEAMFDAVAPVVPAGALDAVRETVRRAK